MTPQAIREGFEQLRSDKQMLPLADAARSRSEADWLVGINGTRAMTAFNSRDGGFFLTTVGRVQTPTLSIVVEREEKIRKHVARDYWEVSATFDAQAGQLRGQVVRPEVQEGRRRRAPCRPAVERTRRAGDRRRGARPAGDRLRRSQAEHAEQPAAVRPDDLAARGQFALRLFGEDDAVARAGAVREAQGADLSAHRFARAARGLPRGREEDDGHAGRRRPAGPLRALAPHARKALDEGYVKPNKRVFDNAKVSDHFAIIPTLQAPKQPQRDRGEALRHGGQALPGGVLPAGRVPADHAHQHREARGQRVQLPDQRQGARQARLARGVRQGSAGRRRQPRRRCSRTRRCAPRTSSSTR